MARPGPGRDRRPLAEYSIAELRARAADYRRMSETATTAAIQNSLRRLADRFDALADQGERDRSGH